MHAATFQPHQTSRTSALFQWGSLTEVLAAVGVIFTTIGAAGKFFFDRSDRLKQKNEEAEAARESELKGVQARLEKMFLDRIANLEVSVATMSTEVDRLRRENSRYLRHVGILEGIMRAQGLSVPPMEDLD